MYQWHLPKSQYREYPELVVLVGDEIHIILWTGMSIDSGLRKETGFMWDGAPTLLDRAFIYGEREFINGAKVRVKNIDLDASDHSDSELAEYCGLKGKEGWVVGFEPYFHETTPIVVMFHPCGDYYSFNPEELEILTTKCEISINPSLSEGALQGR